MEHLNGIVLAFQQYYDWQSHRFHGKQEDWNALQQRFKQMIPNMTQKFKYSKFCLNENQNFLNQVVSPNFLDSMFGSGYQKFLPKKGSRPRPLDLDKVKS